MPIITLIVMIIILCLLVVVLVRDITKTGEQEKLERTLREEIASNRTESSKNMDAFSNSLLKRVNEIAHMQKNQLDVFSKQLTHLTQVNEQKIEKVSQVVSDNLKSLQDDNSAKLEKMRETVDEKLHSTLEKRLGESFQVVSDRLEKVHQGLGEMQSLATGVGDLKKVLTNVKTRGTWGEVQLKNLLEQVLTFDQYESNVVTKKGSRDPVEFAIKLPGKEEKVLLPIDSKFPLEDYERLQDARDEGALELIEDLEKAIESRIKLEAKKIKEKYIDPPHTTDFGILFLPIEGLYAEVIRRAGLCDHLQNKLRVVVAGPTTIAALLNSLQMGFRTLAVERQASDVWQLLGVVKTEFHKFGNILDKTQEKLQQASNNIELASKKSRTIERKLKNVEELPASIEENLLEDADVSLLIEPINDESKVS